MRLVSAALISVVLLAAPLAAVESDALTETMRRQLADEAPPEALVPEHEVLCSGGMAGAYPCDNVDLLEFVPLASLGGASGANDIWGWTDPASGREFALVGLRNGTAFVEITDPENAVYLGRLPSSGSGNSTWRDIKVYQHHAFIVSDFDGCHGMQVFDLTALLSVASPPVTFAESAHYSGIGSAHNVAINEASGFAYLVGGSSSTAACPGIENCAGGLHMVNIQNPATPTFAGCFSADGYTHDAQCVLYDGPDPDHLGDEICFAANEDTLTIVDVTDKSAATQISRTAYAGNAYTHQGWLTDDRRYFLIDDELDESDFGHNTYTYVWDVANLEQPQLLGHFTSPTQAIDHNQYVKGSFVFQANYRSGLRILRLDDPASATLSQVGYFDIYPASDTANFNGAWSVYPYFPSGNVVVSGIEQGLFVLRPRLCTVPAAPTALAATPNGDQRIDLAWSGSGTPGNTFSVERALGGCGGSFETLATGLTDASYADTSASGQVTYGYRVRESDPTGFCTSQLSTCDEASTTGACTAPPLFAGLASATNAAASSCAVELAWSAATATCGGSVAYDVYRGTDELFVPGAGNRIAQGVLGGAFTDVEAASSFPAWYVVRAVDLGNASADGNLVHRAVTPTGPVADGTFATGAEVGDHPLDTFGGGAPPDALGDLVVPEHAGWHVMEVRPHSGLRSFGSGAASGACISLEGDFTLTPAQSSQLTFWTVWDIEATYDGGIVQLSTDGGATWTQLTPSGGYPNTITEAGNACVAMPPGTPAFSSAGQTATYLQKTVNLSPWSGQSVRLAFRYGTDGAVTGEGWYVDDLAVTHVQVPGSCQSNGIFTERFEGGSFGAWSAVTP